MGLRFRKGLARTRGDDTCSSEGESSLPPYNNKKTGLVPNLEVGRQAAGALAIHAGGGSSASNQKESPL